MPLPHSSPVAALLARAAQALQAGRPGDAVAACREAARLQPDHPAVQHELGVAWLESGLPAEAAVAFRLAIAGNPRLAKAHWRLGVALETLGDAPAAIAAYRRATELQPSLTEAHFRAANLLEISGQADAAIARFRRAATSGPKTAFGRIGAARALLARRQDGEAERVLRRAVAFDPGNAMAADLLGTVLADAGRFDEARDCYERAIAKAPWLAGSYYDLVRCRTITEADRDLLVRMQAALAAGGLDATQRQRVHLGIGKAADDLAEYELAMRHFDAADAIRSTLAGFDATAFAARAEWIIAACTAERIARSATYGCDDATPVLIVGMPRSGTTLVEQIVSAHAAAVGGGELHFWNQRGFLWLQGGPPADDAAFLAGAAADYLAALRALAPAAARVTDKMPLNFLWVGLVHLALPRATIIHCRRTPIDTALSIHQTYFNARLEFPTGGDELVACYRTYRRLMAHWRRVLPADRFVEIDYETLTAEPEPSIRRIVEATGLDWDEACLHPERNARVLNTPSKWQARQPIHRGAVGRWRQYEPWLGRLRPLLDDGPAPPDRHSFPES